MTTKAEAIAQCKRLPDGEDVCLIMWTHEDILQVHNEENNDHVDAEPGDDDYLSLSVEKLNEYIRRLEDSHDCNYGITWADIRMLVDEV